ncbi:wall-associated receptor kinase 5-like [Triticum aestivum]|uniref:wall-associated receptor kinase 5-like n=1 Tax=Triticum aestivum TaxID=4565 RepID=UPI001D03172A|nr:wall-associated receptor kinase 5-like [Triticum aestivum]
MAAAAGATFDGSISLPGCPDKHGDVPIPYPFSIGVDCGASSRNSSFNLICNGKTDPPRLMVGHPEAVAELADISLEHSEMRVLSPVSHICFKSNITFTKFTRGYEMQDTPFLPSPWRNHFIVIGCNTLGLIGSYKGAASQYVAGWYSYCDGVNNTSDGAPCAGMGCCEAAIPANLTTFEVISEMNQSKVWGFNLCFYTIVAEVGWYNFRQQDLIGSLGFINDRALGGVAKNGSCPEEGKDTPNDCACICANSHCMATNNGPGYLCQCSKGYEGNPYLLNGCQDTDECALRKQDPKYEDLYPCRKGVCHNTPGSYLCKCKTGNRSGGTNFRCKSLHSPTEKLVIGLSVYVSATVVMAFTCMLLMQFQRKRHKRENDEYFKQNGGLKLYDEMRSRHVDTIRILTEKETNRATDNYNENRVIGCGDHGVSTVMVIFIASIFFPAVGTLAGASSGRSTLLPDCPDKCGNVSIPYPFGIGAHCAAISLNSYFNLDCDSTVDPPRPTAGGSEDTVEIADISLKHGEMRVYSPVNHICFTSNTTFTKFTTWYDLKHTPFLPSPSRNHFTVIGCDTLGLITGYKETAGQYVTGCYSNCEGINSTSEGAPCAGMGCCEVAIPTNLISLEIIFEMKQSRVSNFNPCFYSMVAEIGWCTFRQQDLNGVLGFIDGRAKRGAPVVVDWAIRNGSCPQKGNATPTDYACISANSYCMAPNNGPGYLCQCSGGYEGNPYLLNGCQG